jgi:predicted membrane protein
MVEYIDMRFGTAGLLQILNNIRNGYEAHRAIQMSLLMTFEELETDWHNYLRNSITWFVYLSNNLYKILFFIAALITVYAFIKITIKKLTHKKDTDE